MPREEDAKNIKKHHASKGCSYSLSLPSVSVSPDITDEII
jgi:hypothetical protein